MAQSPNGQKRSFEAGFQFGNKEAQSGEYALIVHLLEQI